MAVARIHGKVKCRPFKEKRRRAPFTKHGITGDGLFVSCFLPFTEFEFLFRQGFAVQRRARKRRGQSELPGFLFSFLPPGNRLRWLAVFKGPNLSE